MKEAEESQSEEHPETESSGMLDSEGGYGAVESICTHQG